MKIINEIKKFDRDLIFKKNNEGFANHNLHLIKNEKKYIK